MTQRDDNDFMAVLQSNLAVDELLEPQIPPGTCAHEVNQHIMIADPGGVLFWPEKNTLIVADLHLEKGSSIARSGQFLPPYDTLTTLRRLQVCIAQWKPRRLIALGDSFHDAKASSRLPLPAVQALSSAVESCEWVWITGNHDPDPPDGIGGAVMNELREDGLIFRHEPQVDDAVGEIAGHLHPKARIIRRGRSVRRPCFAANDTRMILPSFGAYTGGLNVLDDAYSGLFQARDFYALMRGDGQVYKISGKDLR